ncbi:MAG: hypothetical protein ABIS36_11540 [Chryseolinea sp.]
MKKSCASDINTFVVLVLLSAMSCEPLYIPDPIDPRLPKYTESGNNVAGALINDQLWKSDIEYGWFGGFYEPDVYYIVNGDSLVIDFRGGMGENDYINISFALKGARVTNLGSMLNLAGEKFQLGNGDNTVSIARDSSCNQMGTGQVYFRSVKYDSVNQIITLSGTFGFNIVDSVCGDVDVTYGRFDVRIVHISGY